MGLLKSFKKVLKSPLGKAALMMGLGHFGPQFLGAGSSGLGQWKNVPWKDLPWWKAGLVAGGAGALAQETDDDKKTEIDTSGHVGYLKARQGNINEWTEWLMDQDDTLTWEEAYAQASDPMFSKAEGGIVGLAQGGRIGLAKGDWSPGVAAEERAAIGKAAADAWNSSPKGKPGMLSTPQQQAEQFASRPVSQGHANEGWQTYAIPPKKPSLGHRIDDAATRFLPTWLRRTPNIKARQKWAKAQGYLSGDPLGVHPPRKGYEWMEDEDIVSSAEGLDRFRALGYVPASDLHGQEGGGDGGQEEWQRLGYPSYAAYLAAMQGGGGGGGAGTSDTTGDYYGFKEW